MNNKSNFLPGVSPKFYGRSKRSQLEALRLERKSVFGKSITDLGVLFSEILPIDWLRDNTSDSRERLFPQVITFWAWASQLLEQNESCEKSLTLIQQWYSANGLEPPVFDTSGYCKARRRMPSEFLNTIANKIEDYADARVEDHHLWYGHRLKAIDGTSVKLMDTPENQAEYTQPSSQKKGCGFPKMGWLGVLDLARGTICDYVTCSERQHDAKSFYQVSDCFDPGDVVIGDRAFCSYGMICKLEGRRVDTVLRLHQKREGKLDWEKGEKLGSDSRLVTWRKPPTPGKSGFTEEEWAELPDELSIRLVRIRSKDREGKKQTMYVATTLREAELYPTEEIALLYEERWKIEVKFRDIKTTMGFEKLRVKSPEMAHLTMQMIQIVYNLVKTRQAEAIVGEAIQIDEVSFKGTLDVLNESRSRYHHLADRPRLFAQENETLDERIRERFIVIRPFRQEPRAIKTRPKPYQYLTKPRGEFKEIQHKSHYRKAA